MYRVEPLFEGPGEKLMLDDFQSYVIEGDLAAQFDEFAVVSVPEWTPLHTANLIKAQVEKATGKRALVIAHNTMFMRLTKLSSSEAAEVIKTAQENNDAQA